LPDVMAGSCTYGFASLIRSGETHWLYSAPKEMGEFFCLAFTEGSRVVGHSLGRLYSYRHLKYAKLVDIRTTAPSVDVYIHMLIETVRYVNGQDVDMVQCRASCPLLRQALKKTAFVPARRVPSHWWGNSGVPPTGTFHLTFLRGDDGIRPYPE